MPKGPLYPIFLNLLNRPVLIVGAGAVALRKARGLFESGASLTVVSPRFAPPFAELPSIEKILRPYEPALMRQKKWTLVFAATNVPAVNQQVQTDAAAGAILCCRCDEQETGDFTGGATGTLPGVILAISTRGASPALARRIRDQAIAAVDPILAQLADLLDQWRPRVKAAIPHPAPRRSLLLKLAGPDMEHCLRAKGSAGAQELFRQWLAETRTPNPQDPVIHGR